MSKLNPHAKPKTYHNGHKVVRQLANSHCLNLLQWNAAFHCARHR